MKIRIRRILIPFFAMLTAALLVEIPLGTTSLFGEEIILWDTLFRSAVSIPILTVFYREDRVFRGKEKFGWKTAAKMAALGLALAAVCTAVIWGLKIPGGRAAEGTLFVGPWWLQALVLFAASPLLEELFFRGVLYGRLKELFSPMVSALLSAVFFGLYHGNPGQGIYGFVLGLYLAWTMEESQTVKAPILVHVLVNGLSFLMTVGNLP